MNSSEALKETVKEKYNAIASQSKASGSCFGVGGCCGTEGQNIMSEDYSRVAGYNPDADLGLGCGLPTELARIREGDTVVDLGSGAGNDCFIARSIVGSSGKVIGVDFTPAMISRARANAERSGFNNVEFRQGDIEDIPITSNKADVVVSNCVLNLVPNKHKVFSEIYRVLKPAAHFSIADIVLEGTFPEKWKQVAELYSGCVTGAIQMNEYLEIINEAGFRNLLIQREKEINLPDEFLREYFTSDEISLYRQRNTKIKSITVYAEKPSKDERNCCEPGNSCCSN
jgi:ubiquinone/menaquinone biosynthesis C-methylase UbiE